MKSTWKIHYQVKSDCGLKNITGTKLSMYLTCLLLYSQSNLAQ